MDAYSNTLKLVAQVVKDFAAKPEDVVNIKNWPVQVFGNDKVKQLVTIEAVLADGKPLKVEIENFQPGRSLSKNIWKDVNGGHTEGPQILDAYHSMDAAIINPSKECLALLGYFVTLNVLGKPISAISGGRAYLADKMLTALKLKSLNVTIHGLGSGGNGSDFDLAMNLKEIQNFVAGGKWRGELVMAIKGGKKKANTSKITENPNPAEW